MPVKWLELSDKTMLPWNAWDELAFSTVAEGLVLAEFHGSNVV